MTEKKLEIVYYPIDKLRRYSRNPQKQFSSTRYVKESIQRFGFRVPLVIKKDGEIVCGHSRYEAAKALGYKELPCLIADDLTEEQIRAFRIADNAVGRKGKWDTPKLIEELGDLEGLFDLRALGIEFVPDIGTEFDDLNCRYPIVPRPDERYDAIIIFCKTGSELAYLATRLGLEDHYRTSKGKKIAGRNYVLMAEQLIERLKEP